MGRTALVTGSAGFIGSHLVERLLEEGWRVVGVDNFDAFYDPQVKRRNAARHALWPTYRLLEVDVRDADALNCGIQESVDVIIHLAARAGVRPSIADPVLYQDVNVHGTQRMLEFARRRGVRQFVFASSSSAYGVNPNVPWREDDHVLLPISPYASTKVCGELLGHVYSHLFGIRFVALRFFTVYGPRQRPDLAIHSFARRMLAGERLELFGDGGSSRDYTYVSDVVAGVRAAMDYDRSLYEVINLGNSRTVTLGGLVSALEGVLGIRAAVDWLPEQPGDVPCTWANTDKAERLLGYRPSTRIEDGLARFAGWLSEEARDGRVPPPAPLPVRAPDGALERIVGGAGTVAANV